MRITKLRSTIKRLFSERKFVIISHNRVRNIPVSVPLQCAGAALSLGLLCWGLYSTAIYFSYDSIITAKAEKIEKVSHQNRILTEHYAVMQRDLKRLADGEAPDKTDYDALVLGQYEGVELPEDSEALIDRLSYLEDRLLAMESYRESFLNGLSERTANEITDLRKVLDIAGVAVPDFKTLANTRFVKPTPKPETPEKTANIDDEDGKRQGGPYIGTVDELSMREPAIMDELAELLVLRNIVERLPIASPMKNARRTSSFGHRRDPITKRRAMHAGLDFAGAYKSPVYSTAPGRVVYAGRKGAYGKFVEVDHGNGIRTRYGHMHSIKVKRGQKVARGDQIGVQGNTGRSTGSHLHYEVRYKGKAVDPAIFLKAGRHVPQT